MITHKFVDWLSYNTDKKNAPIDETAEPIKPISNYKHGYRLKDGTRVYSGHNKTSKLKIILDGRTMANIRQGMTDFELLDNILSEGSDVSRVDMAIDMYVSDDLILPSDFMDYFVDNKIISSHVDKSNKDYKPKFIGSIEDKGVHVETLNFGDIKKRGKKGIVRVYDKGVELDLSKYLITRLEVEDKREKAMVSVRRIVESGDIGSVIRTRFDVCDDRFQGAIDAKSVDITRGTGKIKENKDSHDSKWLWLIGQVAPALGRQLAEDFVNGFGRNNVDIFEDVMLKSYHKELLKNGIDLR